MPVTRADELDALAERPFWSDDFDMDFPKIFPDARKMLGDLAGLELITTGTPDRRTGRLNHPAVWNHERGSVAFFGFKSPCRDQFYAAPSSQEIRCSAWEAFRDAWPHHLVMIVEQQVIWDTGALWPEFEIIMWNLRGWGDGKKARLDVCARRKVMSSFTKAVRTFGRVADLRAQASIIREAGR
jgi:hypothetical protein